MTTEIAVRGMDDVTLATMLAKSRYFSGVTEPAHALAKILCGREMGFGPVSSLLGVHIIEGKPSVSAGLMASAVKRSGRYDYRIRWLGPEENPSGCAIDFLQGSEALGTSTFTTKDAEAAGLLGKNVWKAYRRNMLFARALSNGVRWYCPDIFQGAVYTHEELGAEVNEEGDALNVPSPRVIEATVTEPAPTDGTVTSLDTGEAIGGAGEHAALLREAVSEYAAAKADALGLGITAKELPADAPLAQVRRWTAMLRERVDAEAAARAATAERLAAEASA